jgi:hypothetical protein
LLANKDVDAVVVSTPDHWHALVAIDAVEAGKDVYLQKPASLTIAEGRALSNAVHRTGRIFQIGSQQRSSVQFRYAAELVRNGRIGALKTVQVGLPGDPSGEDEPEMPTPKDFDYEAWLGSTPHVYYTGEARPPPAGLRPAGLAALRAVRRGHDHRLGRAPPGQRPLGDGHRAHGAGRDLGRGAVPGEGPLGRARSVQDRGPLRERRAHDRQRRLPNGIRFEGTEGWLFVSRGNEQVTSSDPVAKLSDPQALAASDPRILKSVIGPDEVHLEVSTSHHGNWLEAIRTRRQPIAPVEVAHRSCSACLLHHIAMKTKRKLYWDPLRERFKNDDEANAMLSRPQRAPYQVPPA